MRVYYNGTMHCLGFSGLFAKQYEQNYIQSDVQIQNLLESEKTQTENEGQKQSKRGKKSNEIFAAVFEFELNKPRKLELNLQI